MDARALERQRPAVHGVVSRPIPAATSARRPRYPLGRALALLLFALVATALLTGIAGGLRRVGIAVAWAAEREWLGHAALAHAALMMSAFMGTVIAIERAVAYENDPTAVNRDIAELLGLSERTIEFHRANLMAKLAATNLTELIARAKQRGWTEPA